MEKFGIFKMSVSEILNYVETVLKTNGYVSIVRGDEDAFLYGEGNIPVMLIAHADISHSAPPKLIVHDTKQGILWAPTGLGADDRAGVLAIIEILERGYRPHVLITDDEERGGTGALEASRRLKPNIKYMIEIDRRGDNEAVFYDDNFNSDFVDYVLSFGWTHAQGTFSDIVTLAPVWGIAGVNVSAGYYQNHTTTEYLILPHLENTIERVCKMLDNAKDAQTFLHVPARKKHIDPALFAVEVNLDELIDYFGCSLDMLENVLIDYYDDIVDRAQQTIIDYVYDLIEFGFAWKGGEKEP